MRNIAGVFIMVLCSFCLFGISDARAEIKPRREARIMFLHHSTGGCIWNGGVPGWFKKYNAEQGTAYSIEETAFPKDSPYGWNNYPYDYWNIWVNNAGPQAYKGEPTLEMLTRKYDVIVLKHCFPVCNLSSDKGQGDVASSRKTIENYKLQYNALKEKMRQFPDTVFVFWTGAAQVEGQMSPENARNSKEFFGWVRDSWDEAGDNIFIWDFYSLEVEDGIYLNPKYAAGRNDSHPNKQFSKKAAPYFCSRLVNILNGQGDTTSILGY
jgi:hypothetical protein